jgi:hypothetical protein
LASVPGRKRCRKVAARESESAIRWPSSEAAGPTPRTSFSKGSQLAGLSPRAQATNRVINHVKACIVVFGIYRRGVAARCDSTRACGPRVCWLGGPSSSPPPGAADARPDRHWHACTVSSIASAAAWTAGVRQPRSARGSGLTSLWCPRTNVVLAPTSPVLLYFCGCISGCSLVEKLGEGNWAQIARALNTAQGARMTRPLHSFDSCQGRDLLVSRGS